MWIDNKIYKEDLDIIVNSVNITDLKNSNILISGGTGLIGSLLINSFLYYNKIFNFNIKIFALVRNIEKAKKMFNKQIIDNLGLYFIEGDIRSNIECDKKIDYIIHTASETSSKEFLSNSIETISISLDGTINLLKFAKDKNIKKFIFLSTMEVYGLPNKNEFVYENNSFKLDSISVRNCYPISKIMAENLCVCYGEKYNFDISILRLTQTFGPGVNYNDKRVFAEFARCAYESKDIILHTDGKTKRSYLYTADAIRAILIVLLVKKKKEIFNVTNENTYCSIYEMANMVKEKITKNEIDVKIEIDDIDKYGYAPTLYMNLKSDKIKKLGWVPKYNLEEMYNRLIYYWKECNCE